VSEKLLTTASIWGNRFIITAIIQDAIITGHLEINRKKNQRIESRVLAWIHLIGMNVGGTAITPTMYTQD
jgi:hypothetical protein